MYPGGQRGAPAPHPPLPCSSLFQPGAWDPKRQACVPQEEASIPQYQASNTQYEASTLSQFRAWNHVPRSPSAWAGSHGGRVLHPQMCLPTSPNSVWGLSPQILPRCHGCTPQAMGRQSPQWWDRHPRVSALPQDFPTSPAQAGEPQTGDTGVRGDRRTPREQGYRVSPGLGTHGAARWVALVTPVPGQACGTRSPQTGCPPPPRQAGGRHHPLPVARGTCHPAWGGSVRPPKPQHYGAPGATLVPLTTGDTQHGGGTSLVTLGDTTPCVCACGDTPGDTQQGTMGNDTHCPQQSGGVPSVSPPCPVSLPATRRLCHGDRG